MQPYQERIVNERDELGIRIDKLQKFQVTQAYIDLNHVDRNLLQQQKMAMIEYHDILNQRINRFTKD